MISVLLVENNEDIMKSNARMLKKKGYQIYKVGSIAKARDVIIFHEIDLIVLDVVLPDGSGIEFCKEVKEVRDIPVIFLNEQDEDEDIIEGFKAGGDDYIVKPYNMEVLALIIEARLRRSVKQKEIFFANLKVDLYSLTAYIDGRDLCLNQKEFAVLSMLVKNKGKKVSKEELFENVWGAELGDNTSALRTTISRVKKKLDTENTGIDINSTHAGYLLEKQNII